MFGTRITPAPEASFTLGFDLASVAGLKQVELVRQGAVQTVRALPGAPRQTHVDFALLAHAPDWYALVVEDQRGRKAYTDPIWVTPAAAATPHKAP
jgi:hypothetical protein